MTDIVKLLRMQHKFGLGADAHKAADTIQALRQRVKELDGYKAAWIETAKHRDAAERELAALKQQGEPVAWMFKVWDGRRLNEFAAIDYEPQHHDVFGWEIIKDKQPLFYTEPPTCFSAGDMADAQAKAFREGRTVGYKEGYGNGSIGKYRHNTASDVDCNKCVNRGRAIDPTGTITADVLFCDLCRHVKRSSYYKEGGAP